MKGARAAQSRGVSIYYEGHLRGDNFWFGIMLGGDDFGFAIDTPASQPREVNMVGETWINPLSD